MPICPFIYINGHAQQRACQSQKHSACSAFLLSHPRPNFRPSNPTSQPSISPHPRAKTDNPTGSFGSSACTFISPAPISASAECISIHGAGAALPVVGVHTIHPANSAGHCRRTKTDLTTIFLQQRYCAPPLIVQNRGASAINTAMFFQS